MMGGMSTGVTLAELARQDPLSTMPTSAAERYEQIQRGRGDLGHPLAVEVVPC